MILYISDLHFGHESVIDFDNRPFTDVEEMDRTLINFWNWKVQKNDEVRIVGDFAFRNKKPFSWYLKQLNGKKHLITGNHDSKLLKDQKAMGYFESVKQYDEISDNGRRVILFHYPIAEWNHFFRDAFLVFGHIHNKTGDAFQFIKKYDKALNAAACINNYMPSTLDELIVNNSIFKESLL